MCQYHIVCPVFLGIIPHFLSDCSLSSTKQSTAQVRSLQISRLCVLISSTRAKWTLAIFILCSLQLREHVGVCVVPHHQPGISSKAETGDNSRVIVFASCFHKDHNTDAPYPQSCFVWITSLMLEKKSLRKKLKPKKVFFLFEAISSSMFLSVASSHFSLHFLSLFFKHPSLASQRRKVLAFSS